MTDQQKMIVEALKTMTIGELEAFRSIAFDIKWDLQNAEKAKLEYALKQVA